MWLSIAVTAALTAACNGNKSSNPTAPTTPTPPGATLRSVVVTSAAASTTTFQMTARADLSDGSSQDVTASSRWEVSDPNLATVSTTGVLTVIHSGHVDVRATYQQMTGTLGMTLSAPQPPQGTVALNGYSQEAPPTAHPLAGVTVTIVQGPDTGKSTTTDATGFFRFTSLQPGVVGAEAVKDGYYVWRLTNLTLDQSKDVSVLMYPTPPKNDSGVSATARCNDASWSWATTRADACAANGGIAYTICPGPLCNSTVTR
jgi:hypothetical protein